MIEQVKFTYSSLSKAFEKQIKTIEDQGEKQIKAFEEHEKQLVESNELIKKDFNIDKDSIPLEEKKNIVDDDVTVDERSSEFMNLGKRIHPDNLICKYKTEGISPKDFINYQDPKKLFKNIRDGNINPKEVLKDQINFKSYLCEIKKGNPKSKPKDETSVLQNVETFF